MSERPTEPRIEPVDVSNAEGELAEILSSALTHDGKPLNIFGVLGRHPKLLKRFNLMGGFILTRGLLPERERALEILATRWDDAELVELLLTAGFYRLVSGFLNSAGVQLDAGVPGWPG